jgi:hypothetical protein
MCDVHVARGREPEYPHVSAPDRRADSARRQSVGWFTGHRRTKARLVADKVSLASCSVTIASREFSTAEPRAQACRRDQQDLVGRFGGEEFVVILPSKVGADSFLERLRTKWTTTRPLPVTFSAGIARQAGCYPSALVARCGSSSIQLSLPSCTITDTDASPSVIRPGASM